MARIKQERSTSPDNPVYIRREREHVAKARPLAWHEHSMVPKTWN